MAKAQESAESEVKALVIELLDNVKKLREEIKLMKFNMQTYQQMRK